MRALALLLVFSGCTGPSADDTPADTAGPSAEDSAPAPKVDTGFALVYAEGVAELSPAWVGEEAYVATSTDGAVEHCRIVNVVEGVPSAESCPGCSFAFDVVLGAGTATGDGCDNLRFTADMFDGDSRTYAFAPTYAYGGSGYTYDDVLLLGYDYAGTFVWTPWAFAEVNGPTNDILYESMFADRAYYHAR